jgi:hypothetical protein
MTNSAPPHERTRRRLATAFQSLRADEAIDGCRFGALALLRVLTTEIDTTPTSAAMQKPGQLSEVLETGSTEPGYARSFPLQT